MLDEWQREPLAHDGEVAHSKLSQRDLGHGLHVGFDLGRVTTGAAAIGPATRIICEPFTADMLQLGDRVFELVGGDGAFELGADVALGVHDGHERFGQQAPGQCPLGRL